MARQSGKVTRPAAKPQPSCMLSKSRCAATHVPLPHLLQKWRQHAWGSGSCWAWPAAHLLPPAAAAAPAAAAGWLPRPLEKAPALVTVLVPQPQHSCRLLGLPAALRRWPLARPPHLQLLAGPHYHCLQQLLLRQPGLQQALAGIPETKCCCRCHPHRCCAPRAWAEA